MTLLIQYIFPGEDLTQLEIENIDDNIIINFNTRKVYSLEGIEYNDKIYYTQYELPGGQQIINETMEQFNLTFSYEIKIDGLNGIIEISNKSAKNGIISYKLIIEDNPELEYWQQANNDMISIDKSGKYNIKLIDNSGNESEEIEINIILTNKPQIEENMIKVIYDSNSSSFITVTDDNYIYNYSKDENDNWQQQKWAYESNETQTIYKLWIPRFCYNNTDNTKIKFLKGTTNIATDNTYIDNDDWTTPEVFNLGGKKTGIWETVTASQVGTIDLISIVNSI